MGVTAIQWTATVNPDGTVSPGFTFNPWIGCTKVSQGCKFCYAEELMDKRYKRVNWGPGGERVKTSVAYWKQPHSWNRKAKAEGVRRRVFCASLADAFEDRPELEAWRNDLFDMIEQTPELDWLLLTKRPDIMHEYIEVRYGYALPNLWLGVSAEDQSTADERIPILLQTPAAVRFVSYEPALGPVDWTKINLRALPLTPYKNQRREMWTDALAGAEYACEGDAEVDAEGPRLHWVIIGGESGSSARPFNVLWAADTVKQCQEAGVAAFVKQLGRNPYSEAFPGDWGRTTGYSTSGNGWLWHLADSHGGDMAEWPAELRVREFPNHV